jgi:hypothetical protein
MTPLGVPVEPDVYRMYARSVSVDGLAGREEFSWVLTSSHLTTLREPIVSTGLLSSIRTAVRSDLAEVLIEATDAALAVDVSRHRTSQLSMMYASLGSGAFGSRGTYTAPALRMPKIQTMEEADLFR